MTKRKPKQYRDERGRFVHASPEVRAGLEAMRPKRVCVDVVEIPLVTEGYRPPYTDAIYRPERKGWLERALQWFTWNRSRA